MPALCPSRASTLHDTTARSNNAANRGRDRTQIDSIGRWDSTAYRQSIVGSPEVESLVSDQLSHFQRTGRGPHRRTRPRGASVRSRSSSVGGSAAPGARRSDPRASVGGASSRCDPAGGRGLLRDTPSLRHRRHATAGRRELWIRDRTAATWTALARHDQAAAKGIERGHPDHQLGPIDGPALAR